MSVVRSGECVVVVVGVLTAENRFGPVSQVSQIHVPTPPSPLVLTVNTALNSEIVGR